VAGLLRYLFFATIARVLVLFVLGLNVRHRERLPTSGPAIIVANHNSHLDTLVLMTLLPLRLLARTHPVAAMDYFLKSRLLAWFAVHIIGILPIERHNISRETDPLAGASAALKRGEILILYPEGSRGEPERLSEFKSGIARLAERHPEVPVVPVYLHGLGKALPKGESLLVPFFCDVFVGQGLCWTGNRREYMHALTEAMQALASEGQFSVWE
jgi:1-acyl-sn-glycerol-3-phosphate acyltransferase